MTALNQAMLDAAGFRGAADAWRKRKIKLLVLGQSTVQDPVLLSDKAAWPNAFTSARNPGFMPKRLIPNPNRGGWWPKVYDEMWDWGYDLDIINGGVGGASLLDHMVGTLMARSALNNYPFYSRRPSSGYPDLGDAGQYVQTADGKIFNVSAGRKRQAFNDGPFAGAVGTGVLQDYIAFGQTTELSGAANPDTSTVVVGGDIADGTLTLTRQDGALFASEATFLPGHDGSQPNINWSGTFGERCAGRGFDPLGILTTATRLANQASPADLNIVYFSQGQSDLGAAVGSYQRAVQILANYYLRRGWIVVLGNTIYSPGSTGATPQNYGNQSTAVDNAIAALSAYYPGRIFAGAKLFTALGSTGAMGGMRVTGAVTGGNLLTISTTTSGSEIVAGQRLFDGMTLIGTVASLGSYNGASGAGTVNLVGGATNVASRTLISVGSGLQPDGVHQNGSMVAAGGSAIAGSLKAFIPQRA